MSSLAPFRTGLLAAATAVILGSPLIGFVTTAQAQAVKIAVVNLELVVAQSAAGQELQGRLAKFQQDTRAKGEGMADAARKIRQNITDGASSLSEAKLAQLQKDYEDAGIAIRRFQDDKQREGQKMQGEGLISIEKQLQPVFEKIRDEGGYDLILNNVPGVVVMANDRVDITKLVIDRLNATGTGGGK